eukprot:CAMPEP_0195073988 /NCGR_PEP_ID=MMETSP0448-20130528/17196_1 /TAXON_ID=66468 /ORGANISM="Heterocapsa triquestra, Strain CCMP 448" /LENGTH=196 /DNA_ID=CAMNT_0040106169 /DNA_START=94 /DNA_END=684 /DNA_ORIENTATION=-
MALVQEWLNTHNEYFGYTFKPFSKMPFKQIWSFKNNDWESALAVWSVLQFWVAVVVEIAIVLILLLGNGSHNMTYIVDAVINVVVAWLWSHIFWFGATKKQGCCCCLVACCTGQVLLLICALLCWLHALGLLALRLYAWGDCSVCFVVVLLQVLRDVCFIYMGLFLFMLWQKAGSEIVPPAVEVKGPSGQTIGNTA